MNWPWKNLNPLAKRALLVHALYWQLMALGGAFINVYLFRLGGGMSLPAYYQFFFNLAIPFAFWMAGKAARKGGSPRSTRIGLVLLEIYFLCFLVLREDSQKVIEGLAIVGGLATGFYWQGFMLFAMELVKDHERHAFIATGQSGLFLASITTTPLVALFLTWMPGLEGYAWVFAAATGMCALAILVSLPLKTPPLQRAGSIKRLLKARKPVGWWPSLFSNLMMGMGSVGALFLASLVAFQVQGNETGSGHYSLANGLFGLVAAWLVARGLKPANRKASMFYAAVAIAALTLPLAWLQVLPLILLYGAGMAVMQSLFGVPMVSTHMALIEASPRFAARREEVMTIREVFINLGRCSLNLYLFFALARGWEGAIGHVFVLLALVPMANYLLMRKYV